MNKGESATRDNVIYLETYRRKHRKRTVDRPERIEAHAFVHLLTDGNVRYGVLGADVDNALSLLEPMLLIGHRLAVMAAE